MFADGNKIGRTYVSSPFAGNDELQSMKFKPMLPTSGSVQTSSKADFLRVATRPVPNSEARLRLASHR